MRCRWCGRTIQRLPWKCHRCGGYFCENHRLPEAHLCLGRGFWSETERREMLRRHAAFMDSHPWGDANGYAGGKTNATQERKGGVRWAVKGFVVLALFAGFVLVAFAAFNTGFEFRGWTPAGTTTELVHARPEIATVNPGLSAANLSEENLISNFDTSPVKRSFAYHDSLGWRERRIELVLYGGYAEYLEELDRRMVLQAANCTIATADETGCIRERIQHIFQERHLDTYMEPLIQAIRNSSPFAGYQARNAISLVQRIPYGISEMRLDLPHENRSMNPQNLYYPYEVLYHDEGVCIDKSILLAYILDRLGYDVVIFLFPPTNLWPEGHAAVGVRTSERCDFFDTGYAFIESTNVTIPTDYPEKYGDSFRITSYHTIVKVGNGTGALDLSTEYSDARELEGMMETGIHDYSHYMRFRALIEKYGLN